VPFFTAAVALRFLRSTCGRFDVFAAGGRPALGDRLVVVGVLRLALADRFFFMAIAPPLSGALARTQRIARRPATPAMDLTRSVSLGDAGSMITVPAPFEGRQGRSPRAQRRTLRHHHPAANVW
jgi:hypothetical protein